MVHVLLAESLSLLYITFSYHPPYSTVEVFGLTLVRPLQHKKLGNKKELGL